MSATNNPVIQDAWQEEIIAGLQYYIAQNHPELLVTTMESTPLKCEKKILDALEQYLKSH